MTPSEKEIAVGSGETLAGYIWRIREPELREVLCDLPQAVREKLLAEIGRIYRPWPGWVLRMAASVGHVQFPTIPAREIENCFRFIQWLFLEARREGGPPPPPTSKLSDFERAELWGKALGHVSAWTEHLVARLNQFPEVAARVRPKLEADRQELWQKAMADPVLSAFHAGIAFAKALAQSDAQTFDSEGRKKETMATRLYEEMLSDWTAIESLSGPTELCRHLEPKLWPGRAELQMERVRQVCSRFKIQFRLCQVTAGGGASVTSGT